MKKENKDTKRLLSLILIVLLITIILVGGTYAFFTAVFTGVEEDTTITIGGGSLGIHMDGGNIITLSNIYPREEAWDTKRFTITGNNNTSLHMPYYLNLIVTENTFRSGSLTYILESQNTSNTGATLPAITLQRGIPTGAGIHPLGGGTFDTVGTDMVHTYYLTFFFPSRGVAQNEDQGAIFNAHVGISGEAPILAENQIKDNNSQIREGSPNFRIVANNANRDAEEGLWRVPDEHGEALVFRGTHQGLNNNVIFAGHQWKILRIEGNGNIRMIYNGVCTLNAEGTNCEEGINGATAGNRTLIANAEFNVAWRNHGRYIGYMFGETTGTFNEQHAHIHDSTIKTVVDNWFNENITGFNKELVANDTIFCINRTIGSLAIHQARGVNQVGTGLDRTPTGYASWDVVATELPTLICPRSEDRLTLPIALITLDEANMAGGRGNQTNNDFFLKSGVVYWTMSPSGFSNGSGFVPTHLVNNNGNLFSIVNPLNGVRPVLALNSNVTFSSGDGSASTPFIVN